MYKKFLMIVIASLGPLSGAQAQGAASALSEQDFLNEMPIVLSVSRLAQRLDETPGAVTILDRQFIHMSGARDVADLLRLVPGFQTTTSFETDAPMATYHGRNDDWANRIQVLVDGRSVYSSHLQGSAGLGWQTLALDDIERIEVLRGSNSATYGARAFLGVVNIISRDVRETAGTAAYATAGDNAIADGGARIGWGDPSAMYRISADSRGDDGLRGAFGKNRIERANFASHFSPSGSGEVDVRAGALNIDAGRGEVGDTGGNSARSRFMGSQFAQLDWRKTVSESSDIAATLSHTEVTNRDRFPYQTPGTYYLAPIDFSGREFIDVLALQHTVRHSAALRTVWGTELRREKVVSKSSFDNVGEVSTDFVRLFGNAEVRLAETVLLNAGAMAERSNIAGESLSPRVMLNWQPVPGHTLRAGTSSAFRPPSAYEKYAAVQYYDVNGGNPTGYYTFNPGTLGAEKVLTQELGYYLNAPRWGVDADVRVFNENIRDGIAHTEYDAIPGTRPEQYLNSENYSINGVEYQVNWRPAPATLIFFNQTWTSVAVDSSVGPQTRFRTEHGSPRLSTALTLMHTFSNQVAVSLMVSRAEDVALMSGNEKLYSMGRADVRVAKSFRYGGHKAELGLVIQNLDVPVQDGNRQFFFDSRAMVTLRFEN